MNKSKLVLYSILVLALIVNFSINGIPENLGVYQSTGLVLILIMLVFLVIFEIFKITKNDSK